MIFEKRKWGLYMEYKEYTVTHNLIAPKVKVHSYLMRTFPYYSAYAGKRKVKQFIEEMKRSRPFKYSGLNGAEIEYKVKECWI